MPGPLDVFKVEVEVPNPDLPNYVRNPPYGKKGAWGWITSTPGVAITASDNGNGLQLTTTTSQATGAASEWAAISPGKWAGARLTIRFRSPNVAITSGHTLRIRLQFADSTKALLSSATQTGALSTATTAYAPTAQAPASAAYVRLRLDLYKGSSTSTNPDAGAFVAWSGAMLTVTPTDPGTAFVYSDPIWWADVTGPSLAVTTDSPALEPGLAAGSVVGTDAAKVLAGKKIRFSGWSGTGWEPFYEGTLGDPVTHYLPKEYVTFDALNNVTRLANTKRKPGVATIDELPFLLEGASVPWDCGATGGNQVPSATRVSGNDNASLLDQIAITRDSDNGYAAVDRFDVLRVARRSTYSTTPVATFNDSGAGGAFSYSDIDLPKSAADSVINAVSITWLRYSGTAKPVTKEISYGPYIDSTSVDTYGAREVEYVLQGTTESKSAIAAFGAAVLAANATPTARVRSITVPIKTDAQRAMACTLKHYDTVRVTYKNVVVNQDLMVTGIRHEVTPDASIPSGIRWLMTLTLAAPMLFALPKGSGRPGLRVASLPRVTSDDTEGQWQAASLASGWSNSGGTTAPAAYRLDDGLTTLKGSVVGGSGTIFTLPAGYRPGETRRFAAAASGAYGQVNVTTAGLVTLAAGSPASFLSLDGITFHAEG